VAENNAPAEGVSLVYQCKLNLSARTVVYLADLLRSHLKAIRSPFRSLPSGGSRTSPEEHLDHCPATTYGRA
jgi:hypothetical protein